MRTLLRGAYLAAVFTVPLMGAEPHEAATQNEAARLAYNRGVVAYNEGHWADAAAQYTQAIATDPTFEAAFRNRGLAETHLNKRTAAEEDFTAAIGLDPADEAVYVERADARLESDDNAGALADAEKALTLDGDDAAAYEARGRALYGLGRYAEALAQQRTIISMRPKQYGTYFYLGLTDLAQCDNADAVSSFTQALDIDQQAGAANDRGIAHSRLDQDEAARADYDLAIKIDPKSPEPLVNRAVLLMDQDKYAPAKADLDAAVALAPQAPEPYRNRAVLRKALHQYVLALQDINYAIAFSAESGNTGGIQYSIDSSDADLYAIRAKIYEKLGRSDLAASDRKLAATKKSAKSPCDVHR